MNLNYKLPLFSLEPNNPNTKEPGLLELGGVACGRRGGSLLGIVTVDCEKIGEPILKEFNGNPVVTGGRLPNTKEFVLSRFSWKFYFQ